MRKFLAVFLVALLLGVVGCTSRQDEVTILLGRIARLEQAPLEYVYKASTDLGEVEVRGRIEDSLREAQLLSISGSPVMERVIYDDVLAVRVIDASRVSQLAKTPEPADIAVAEALKAGQWVVDPAGAPDDAAAVDRSAAPVGTDPLADASALFQYVRRCVDEAFDVIPFNPDALDYRRDQDPFPHPKGRDDTRYVLVPPPLPRREGDVLPRVASFRLFSLYLTKGRITKVLEQIEIENQPEIKRARETGRNKFLRDLPLLVKAGRTEDQVSERTMSFEVTSFGDSISLALPVDGVIGNLRVLFAPAVKTKTGSGTDVTTSPAAPPVVPPA